MPDTTPTNSDPQRGSKSVPADEVAKDGTDLPLPSPGEGSVPPTATEDEPETFDREYVQKLRDENAKYRQKAKRADDLARELFHHRVTALGKLADPTDLPYDEALLDDGAALEAAVDELLARKPHLADRRPRTTVAQGAREPAPDQVSLADILRAAAG